ncbi:GntR family transcriptional regulator [Oryzifoliimicrobium ureilyticus]|uniref:GntR family transcriptional regulator n=1 Tax=Oryzifoliimicrobium ureilyticus TaxID=3113724 RepID=UPI003075F9D0
MDENDDLPTTTVYPVAIKRASLHHHVVDKLREMVSRGDLPAGERLNEVALAQALGVSRTPMREAVKLLASEGLLELLPGRGARVRQYSAEELMDVFDVLGALERHAIEIAVSRMKPKALAAIERLHIQMGEAYAKRNKKAYFKANQKLHGLIVELAGNPQLAATHMTLTKQSVHNRHETLMSEQRWKESVAEHQAIFDAIVAKNAALAGVLMLDHSRKTGAAVVDAARAANEIRAASSR